MEMRRNPWLLVLLTLCGVSFSRTVALSPRETSAVRLDNFIPLEEPNEPDQASFQADTDVLQNDLPYYDVSRNARHSDAVFTSEYSKFLQKLAAKKFLESLGNQPGGENSGNQGTTKRHSDAVFTDNYTRFRKQLAVKKYLNSILHGKRGTEGESSDSLKKSEK